uniref:Uncharacterized protein n=1 Tax=Rhizophora mucronata TaxID=61149 RepID=A0A2P2R385_RHIMU
MILTLNVYQAQYPNISPKSQCLQIRKSTDSKHSTHITDTLRTRVEM